MDDCVNFEEAMTLDEIHEIIKEENIDLRVLCEQYGLKYKIMRQMIKGNMMFDFRYYTCLLARAFEVEEFEKYVDRFNEEVGECD